MNIFVGIGVFSIVAVGLVFLVRLLIRMGRDEYAQKASEEIQEWQRKVIQQQNKIRAETHTRLNNIPDTPPSMRK